MLVGCLLLALAPGVAALAVAACAVLFRRPKVFKGPPGDCLILAAHPDDCVVMAGEYAMECLAAGRSVDVVYLTCGDSRCGSKRARIRRSETIAAWSLAGLPAERLHFLDYPHSPLGGRRQITQEQMTQAAAQIAARIAALPANGVVFVPARGETHIDHTAMREIGLGVLRQVNRPNLAIMETPEYNVYCSLLHAPVKSLRYVLASLPVVGRLFSRETGQGPHGFIDGPAGVVLPRDPARLQKKKAMLAAFGSQNGPLLVRYFGYPDLYRPLISDPIRPARYLRVGPRRLGLSVIGLWLSIWAMSFLLCMMLAARAASAGWPPVILVGVGVMALAAALRRRAGIEECLLGFLAGVGILAGML